MTYDDNEILLGAIVLALLPQHKHTHTHTLSSPNTHFTGLYRHNCPGFQVWAMHTGLLPESTVERDKKESLYSKET